ncbi:SLC13 family permease [Nautilia sp.]
MKKILIAFLIGFCIGVLSLSVFNLKYAFVVGIISFLVALWTNEGLPLGVVSLLPIILFPSFSILSTNEVTQNYSKSIIFLFLGGFLLAIAAEKTGLHKIIANKLLSVFPKTPRGVIFSLGFTSAVLSSFLSNTTTALLLVPLAMFLSDKSDVRKRLVIAVAYGASIGGIITPIGTPPNLIFLGFAQDHNLRHLTFFEWIIYTLPLAVVMIIFMSYLLSFNVKGSFDLKIDKKAMTPEQKRLSYILAALIVLLFLNSPIKPFWNGLGFNDKLILLSFGVLMFFPKIGFLTWEDSKKIPFEIIFLFGAGFSIAMAISKSGLAKEIASYLDIFSYLTPFVFLMLIVAFVTFSTEITSNTALISIVLPIIYSLHSPVNKEFLLMSATIAASYAFMLPIATPPNAIAFASGDLKIKDMAKTGFFMNIFGVIALSLISYFFWR